MAAKLLLFSSFLAFKSLFEGGGWRARVLGWLSEGRDEFMRNWCCGQRVAVMRNRSSHLWVQDFFYQGVASVRETFVLVESEVRLVSKFNKCWIRFVKFVAVVAADVSNSCDRPDHDHVSLRGFLHILTPAIT